jgi:mRNA-degrading endonuclease toxin of MazEF toxin-antitoxin module
VADLKRGRIVWVELLDPQGQNPKVRPAVILTPTDEIDPSGEVQVVAITGETTAAPAEECVILPWHAGGHPRTALTKPSVAVISWAARVPVAAIQRTKGNVPGPLMLEILRRVADREGSSPSSPPPPPADDSSPPAAP